ncbi:DUF4893 domain-containing protein [Marinivivus vitaminiproducens]|uniref:DUF4893 domain-containing protein n=1 Tax=Marinivivus vitaminiproducens TaxID=3035935 RepID=UPI00279B540A|nr:DUF4893 domain-containing protein [Geminicoccaceae bacterium SCSIO 64248]
MRMVLTALVAMTMASSAWADGFFPGRLSPADQARLERFDEARAQAVADARARGKPDAVAELDAALAGNPGSIAPADMAGEWRCREIDMGGRLALAVGPEVRCRILDDAAGLRLETIDGSQRLSGTFYDIGEARLGFAGALATGTDAPLPYGRSETRDQVGYVVPVARDRVRIEMPRPIAEFSFQILELRR